MEDVLSPAGGVWRTGGVGRWRVDVITVQMCERVELSETFDI